jgi:hypothetical protein
MKTRLCPRQRQNPGQSCGAGAIFKAGMELLGAWHINKQDAGTSKTKALQARPVKLPPRARMPAILQDHQIARSLRHHAGPTCQTKTQAGRLIHERRWHQLSDTTQSQAPAERLVKTCRPRRQDGTNPQTMGFKSANLRTQSRQVLLQILSHDRPSRPSKLYVPILFYNKDFKESSRFVGTYKEQMSDLDVAMPFINFLSRKPVFLLKKPHGKKSAR